MIPSARFPEEPKTGYLLSKKAWLGREIVDACEEELHKGSVELASRGALRGKDRDESQQEP